MGGRTATRTLLVAVLAVAGCRRNITVPPELQAAFGDQIAFCERMSGDVVDWCIYQMVNDNARPGQDYYPLCKALRDQDARDGCLEMFGRTDEAARYEDVCVEIGQQRLRESCYLTMAERTTRVSGTISAVIAACQKAGDRELHCLTHVPAQRVSLWQSWGSAAIMSQEIAALIQSDPQISGQAGFGHSVGQAAIELQGAQGEALCHLFPRGDAGNGCEETYQAWRQGSLSFGQGPGGMPSASGNGGGI